ncbi:hypothetical protein LQZ18_11000 [Lachnospiraceae bacterium ZAX-1]
MKIRADFVTNSSSVSYIVSFNADMADWGKFIKTKRLGTDPKNERIFALISADLQKTGEVTEQNGNAILFKQYNFEKKPECKYDTSFETPINEVDFAALTDDEVWAYIYGEYLVNARLGAELKGFGALQVPRDKEALKHKKETIMAKIKESGDA